MIGDVIALHTSLPLVGEVDMDLAMWVLTMCLGWFLAGKWLADRTNPSPDPEDALRRHVALVLLNEAHAEAVEMLAEDGRGEELARRASDRLDETTDEFADRAALAEVDPIGAEVLGPAGETYWFPGPPADVPDPSDLDND